VFIIFFALTNSGPNAEKQGLAMTNLLDTADTMIVAEAELDLGVAMIDEMAVRIPFCATSRIPFCSLKANAEGAKALLSI
jgi:hypothetical protein